MGILNVPSLRWNANFRERRWASPSGADFSIRARLGRDVLYFSHGLLRFLVCVVCCVVLKGARAMPQLLKARIAA